MPVWNSDADYCPDGYDIYDPITKTVYTEEQAKELPKDIRKNLVNRARTIGCFVKTLEELK